MADNPVAEEGRVAGKRPVDELVRYDEVRGLVLFLQAADGRDREDGCDAGGLQRVDVRAERELGRENAMAFAVAREKDDAAAFKRAEDERVRGIAKGSGDGLFVDAGEAGHGVTAAAADDADLGLGGRLRQGCGLLVWGQRQV